MRFETKLPKKYDKPIWDLPAFNQRGRVTRRVLHSLENTLYLHTGLARHYSGDTDNNPGNFKVESVCIVGSSARENRIDSDLDYLLICPKIDPKSGNQLKTIISFILFCDRPKREAVDVYIRPADAYPERESIDITSQVRKLLDKYNRLLDK